MSKDLVKPEAADNMAPARGIMDKKKATREQAHSRPREHVNTIAFPQQQGFPERASMLRFRTLPVL
jgi:hypothetical protein